MVTLLRDKNRWAQLLLALLCSAGGLLGISLVAYPVLRGEKEHRGVSITPNFVELGEVDEGEIGETSIRVSNPTEEAVIVRKINTSCSCTVLDTALPFSIASKASMEIPVSIETKGRSGVFESQVAVMYELPAATGSASQHVAIAQFRAFVRPAVWCDQAPLQLGPLKAGERKQVLVDLHSNLPEYEVTGVKCSSSLVDVEVRDGDFSDGTGSLALSIDLSKQTAKRSFGGTVFVNLTGGAVDQVALKYSGSIDAEIAVTPSSIVIPLGKQSSRRLTVSLDDECNMVNVTSKSRQVVITEHSEVGGKHTFDVRFSTSQDAVDTSIWIQYLDSSGSKQIESIPVKYLSISD